MSALTDRLPRSVLAASGATLFAGVAVVPRVLRRFRAKPVGVAEVGVDGPIVRERPRRPLRGGTSAAAADDVVDQIEAADEDEEIDGLLVRLNTPGGQVVPSDDIRLAIDGFDGPTVAYATDVCGSGGYWIASACDELFAREASIVGSIGVIGSRVNAAELADRVGLSYERFAAGDYKDAGVPLREIDDDEREYLQGLIDDIYEQFVDRVTEGRSIDPETVRDTEARVYLGTDALDLGLVDALGTRDDAKDRLAELLGVDEVDVEAFEPPQGLLARFRGGAEASAYAFGAGIASAVVGDPDRELEIRL